MKYTEPKMKISRFYEPIKTAGEVEELEQVLSGNYNEATKSLEQTFIEVAGSAKNVLVYKWN